LNYLSSPLTLTPATPTEADGAGEIAILDEGWGTGLDSISFYDGTSAKNVVTTADTCTDGQLLEFQTGGTWTCEDAGGTIVSLDAISTQAADDDIMYIVDVSPDPDEDKKITVESLLLKPVFADDTSPVDVSADVGGCRGGIYWKSDSSAMTYNLPACDTLGLECTFTTGTNTGAITIDPNGNDNIIKDGVLADDGEAIVSSGVVGDLITLVCVNVSGYWVNTTTNGTWVEASP